MFYMVCVSTERSSVRVGCASALEAQAKVVEFEETGLGKVRIFDDAGKRISKDDLLVVRDPVADEPPVAEGAATPASSESVTPTT